jgi:signal transduction histidine kinase
MTSQAYSIQLEQRHAELHELCQPLTALQCRLEIGRLQNHEGALVEAVNASLKETQRMFEVIARIRQRLLADEENSARANQFNDQEDR